MGALHDTDAEVDDFRLLISPHLTALRRFAAVLVRASDVDDVVQDTLARAWTKRAQYDAERGSAAAWMMAILADRARERWRARSPSLQLDERDGVVPETDATVLDLRAAVNALPRRQRTAIVLYHYLDLPVGEVAVLMRCSTGTVKSTLSDARRSLATRLGASYVESG